MTRQVIYEIGKLRVWYEPPYTYFEIIDSHKRLETSVSALNELPHLFRVLIEILETRLENYVKELARKRDELTSMLDILKQKISESEGKHEKEYVKELERKKESITKRIEQISSAIRFTMKLRDKLAELDLDLVEFIGITEKIWLGGE